MLNWLPASQIGDVLLKHPNLKKLLKSKTLAALLTYLETLSSSGLALGVYNAEGQFLAGSATLSTDEIISILRADSSTLQGHPEPIPVKPGQTTRTCAPTKELTRTLVIDDEPVGVLVATCDGESPLTPRLSLQLDAAADLLTHLITQALENRTLAQETLERYREINLLYRIQEAIGARLDLDQIANLVLEESIRIIKATSGALLLLTADQPAFNVQARQGQAPVEKRCAHTDTIAGWVVRNRRAAIVNDISADLRCGPADAGARTLLCVPLTTGEKSTGALALYDKVANRIFTASDQKLLMALASQAAIAIETTREVEARESRLKAQIRELRIEIDEIRKGTQVASITATDYFAQLQQSAQEMRREFEEEL